MSDGQSWQLQGFLVLFLFLPVIHYVASGKTRNRAGIFSSSCKRVIMPNTRRASEV